MAPANAPLQPAAADAREAGLIYVSNQDFGIQRVKRGSGFGYVVPGERSIRDPKALKRIKSIGIPPA